MFKKGIALLLALACTLALGTSFAAESTPSITFDPATAAFEGTWVPFADDGFQVYLPTAWSVGEVDETMQAQGVFFYAFAADASATATFLYNTTEGLTDADTLASGLSASGVECVRLSINGLDGVGYELKEGTVAAFSFFDAQGGYYTLTFTPANEEAQQTIGQTILYSASPLAAE